MGANAAGLTEAGMQQQEAALYADDSDRKRHRAHIAAIAQEEQKDIAEVSDCYEHILHDLRSQARVHDFLNIFVAKRVLERLKARH